MFFVCVFFVFVCVCYDLTKSVFKCLILSMFLCVFCVCVFCICMCLFYFSLCLFLFVLNLTCTISLEFITFSQKIVFLVSL